MFSLQSIKTRILFWQTLMVFLALGWMAVAEWTKKESAIQRSVHLGMQRLTFAANAYLLPLAQGKKPPAGLASTKQVKRLLGEVPVLDEQHGRCDYVLWDRQGQRLEASAGVPEWVTFEIADEAMRDPEQLPLPVVRDVYLYSSKGSDGYTVSILMARDVEERRRTERFFLYIGLVALGTLLSVGVNYWIVSHEHRPIREIDAAARRIAREGEGRLTLEGKVGSLELRGLVEALNASYEKLGKLLEQERTFSSNVAHELRTPISVMKLLHERMEKKYGKEEGELLSMNGRSLNQMSSMVEMMLMLSKVESGQIEFEEEEVELKPLFERLQTLLESDAEKQGVKIELKVEVEKCQGNEGALEQILLNLLSNAIRHSEKGGKVLLASSSVRSGIQLEVSDEGEGMAPEVLDRIFDRFYRGDEARTHGREVVGVGLGLTIVRELVNLLGGKIEVESELGFGTRFLVRLPEG